MDDLLRPLEVEYEKLVAEQAELDDLSQALENQHDKINELEKAAQELMNQIRMAGTGSAPSD